MPYPAFDRSRLILEPLAQRRHDMQWADVLPLNTPPPPFESADLATLARRMRAARDQGAQRILMMGAHVIKVGLSRFVVDLIEQGWVTHVALNGAGAIHDFELALAGATTESVAHYIRSGRFGMWQETGRINDIAREAAAEGLGLGEALGRTISGEGFPHAEVSILAAGYRRRVPVTVHVALGQDIIHQHPNCDGAALGAASYQDFLVFTQSICGLQGGTFLCFGSAVMGPEVYLKALSMARNVARQENRSINAFTTAVFDLIDLGSDLSHEAPKHDPRYYYRPFKTILVRTVQDLSESFYIRGDHRETLINLYHLLR